MNLERFVTEREPSWKELEGLVGAAAGRPERLGPSRALRLAALYRSAAADLAIARRRWPSDRSVTYLEHLVGRSRHLVYASRSKRGSLISFFARHYWQMVAARPVPLAVAALILFGAGGLCAVWGMTDPVAASGLVPPEFQAVTEPRRGGDLGIPAQRQALISTAIFLNNIRVTFLAFAAGMAAALGTAVLLGYNGIILGTVAGLAIGAGNGPVFLELVVAHGVLELSCIVVTAAAGLRLGWAMIEPGRKRRLDAVVTEARSSVAILLGTMPWLVLAGIVEGNITGSGLGIATVTAVGFALGAIYWMLVILRGRRSRGADRA